MQVGPTNLHTLPTPGFGVPKCTGNLSSLFIGVLHTKSLLSMFCLHSTSKLCLLLSTIRICLPSCPFYFVKHSVIICKLIIPYGSVPPVFPENQTPHQCCIGNGHQRDTGDHWHCMASCPQHLPQCRYHFPWPSS